MLKKPITYTDYNGVERTEDFYFNLTKAELMEMELGVVGGMSTMLQKIVSSIEIDQIIAIFKDIILRAYGEKSPDGKRFIKSEELATNFSQTEAYSELFIELASDTDKAINFINGIMPEGFATDVSQEEILKVLPKNEVTKDVADAVSTE